MDIELINEREKKKAKVKEKDVKFKNLQLNNGILAQL